MLMQDKDFQSKNCAFMVLEANCSIIAACFPCYGPLFRGGRSQLSLIASVRSMFSLRSRGSNASSRNYDGLGDDNQGILSSASEIELKNAPALKVKGGQTPPVRGINVTRSVEMTLN